MARLPSPFGRSELPYEFAVIVPSTRFEKKISKSAFKKRVLQVRRKMHELFGGTTRTETVGTFTSKRIEPGLVIQERGERVVSFSDAKAHRKHGREFEAWLATKANHWLQESISVEYEGNMYFVEADPPIS